MAQSLPHAGFALARLCVNRSASIRFSSAGAINVKSSGSGGTLDAGQRQCTNLLTAWQPRRNYASDDEQVTRQGRRMRFFMNSLGMVADPYVPPARYPFVASPSAHWKHFRNTTTNWICRNRLRKAFKKLESTAAPPPLAALPNAAASASGGGRTVSVAAAPAPTLAERVGAFMQRVRLGWLWELRPTLGSPFTTRKLRADAVRIYTKFAEAYAVGDLSSLREMCSDPFFQILKKEIAERRVPANVKVEWVGRNISAKVVTARIVMNVNPRFEFTQITMLLKSQQGMTVFDSKSGKQLGGSGGVSPVSDYLCFETNLLRKQPWIICHRVPPPQ